MANQAKETVTEKQMAALRAILHNPNHGTKPLPKRVDRAVSLSSISEANPTLTGRQLSGLLSTLSQRKLVETGGHQVSLTKAGHAIAIAAEPKPAPAPKAKRTKASLAAPAAATHAPESRGKARQVIVAACSREEGATAEELFAATNWKFASWSHQIKLAAKATGWTFKIEKVDGRTRYFLLEPAAA